MMEISVKPRIVGQPFKPSWKTLVEQDLEENYFLSGRKKACCLVIANRTIHEADMYVGDDLIDDPVLGGVVKAAKELGYLTPDHMKDKKERIKQSVLVVFLDGPYIVAGESSHAYWVQKYTAIPVWRRLEWTPPETAETYAGNQGQANHD